MNVPARAFAIAGAAALLAVGAAGCGGADGAALDTLPPIQTTTSTVVPETTADDTKWYHEVKQGENLGMIAQKYCVPRDELVALNRDRLPNPDLLYVGAMIELPRGVKIAGCEPDATVP